MSWYKTGTVTVAQGNTVVTGAGTMWSLNAQKGDAFIINVTDVYQIDSVTNNETIVLTAGYSGTGGSGLSYAILPMAQNALSVPGLAQQVSDLLNKWNGRENEFMNWMSGSVTGGAADSLGNGTGGPYYPMTSPAPSSLPRYVACPAALVGPNGPGEDFEFTTGSLNISGANRLIGANGGGAVVSNLALGTGTLAANVSGTHSVAIGINALNTNTAGISNTAVGSSALINSLQNNDVAVGREALKDSGGSNVAVGSIAMTGASSSASHNVAIGYGACSATSFQGVQNVAIGSGAGSTKLTGGSNTNSNLSVYVGYNSLASAAGVANEIAIGAGTAGSGSNTATLGNASITKTILRGDVYAGSYNVNGMDTVPASATASGTTGEIRFCADGIYLCIASNVWVKTVLATF